MLVVLGGGVIASAHADDGTIEAIGTEQQGGHVEVLGERVALLDEANIDASGETDGGESDS